MKCMDIQTEMETKRKQGERRRGRRRKRVTKVKIFNTSERLRVSKKRTNFVCYM